MFLQLDLVCRIIQAYTKIEQIGCQFLFLSAGEESGTQRCVFNYCGVGAEFSVSGRVLT